MKFTRSTLLGVTAAALSIAAPCFVSSTCAANSDKTTAGNASAANEEVGKDYNGGRNLARPLQPLSVSYWIELTRAGKVSKATNKTDFHSGDQISLHIRPNAPAYAYLVYQNDDKEKTHKILFPDSSLRDDNKLDEGDNVIPSHDPIVFDNDAGTEHVLLIVSRKPVDADELADSYKSKSQSSKQAPTLVAMAPGGSKDLIPDGVKIAYVEEWKPITKAAGTTSGDSKVAQSSSSPSEKGAKGGGKATQKETKKDSGASKSKGDTVAHQPKSDFVPKKMLSASADLKTAQGVMVSESKLDGHAGVLPIEISMQHSK